VQLRTDSEINQIDCNLHIFAGLVSKENEW
jgi:hypothetical protein